MKRRTGLRRTAPSPKNRKRMKRSRPRAANPERRAQRRREAFGEHAGWIIRLPCCTCRPELYTETHDLAERVATALSPVPISEPSHVGRSRGAGGKARDLAPQCEMHHELWHTRGRLTFSRELGDPRPVAERLARISPYLNDDAAKAA